MPTETARSFGEAAPCQWLVLIAMIVSVSSSPTLADCTLTSTAKTPLPDLGSATYLGHEGGLYAGGVSVRPEPLDSIAQSVAAQIVPLDTNGLENAATGRIVFLSIGISNTAQEFLSGGPGSFMARMQIDPSKNPKLDILNGAYGGHAAIDWANPADTAWSNLQQVLANANRDPLQVQVIWMKHADRIGEAPDPTFPAHALWHQNHLETVLRLLQDEFPNLKLAFVSSRTRSYGLIGNGASPEPISYESGFSVKWLIEKQQSGAPTLNYDINMGPVEAPLVVWGPYLWTDGLVPRSDQFTWDCADLQADFSHPSPSGVTKVADQLIAFFKTDPLACGWFLRSTITGQPPSATIQADALSGSAPLTVNFNALAADPDGAIVQTAWTYGDGTFALTSSAQKAFLHPGTYPVHLTIVDNAGNTATASVNITVHASGDVPTLGSWSLSAMMLLITVAATLTLRRPLPIPVRK